MPRLADHPAGIQPLGRSGRLVLVDRHPICEVCGRAVAPTGPASWRHVPAGRSAPTRSRFLPAPPAPPQSYVRHLRSAGRRRILRPGENPYLDLFTSLTAGQRLPARRRELAALFSWAIPTEEALATIGSYAPIVECAAGMGYWAALLRARGVDVAAYDLDPPGRGGRNTFHARRAPWTEIQPASAVAAVSRHAGLTLFLCWPPHDDDAASYAPLRAYDGETVCIVGEPAGGATGTVRFHRELALNWRTVGEVALPTWPGLRDRLVIYRRSLVRRALTMRDRCYECGRFIRTGGIGRCDACFRRRPPALALQYGNDRLEYPLAAVTAMPPALRMALESSPHRIA